MAEEQQMNEKKNVMTYSGLRKYEEELHNLKVVRRKEVAQKLKEAREQGDLSENAEYDAAKDEQREIEDRINVIEEMLKNAEVIADDDIKDDRVSVGSKVTLYDNEEDEEVEYSIVGSSEANILENKLSNESLVGQALLGHKVGETVNVSTPAGESTYKILKIERSN